MLCGGCQQIGSKGWTRPEKVAFAGAGILVAMALISCIGQIPGTHLPQSVFNAKVSWLYATGALLIVCGIYCRMINKEKIKSPMAVPPMPDIQRTFVPQIDYSTQDAQEKALIMPDKLAINFLSPCMVLPHDFVKYCVSSKRTFRFLNSNVVVRCWGQRFGGAIATNNPVFFEIARIFRELRQDSAEGNLGRLGCAYIDGHFTQIRIYFEYLKSRDLRSTMTKESSQNYWNHLINNTKQHNEMALTLLVQLSKKWNINTQALFNWAPRLNFEGLWNFLINYTLENERPDWVKFLLGQKSTDHFDVAKRALPNIANLNDHLQVTSQIKIAWSQQAIEDSRKQLPDMQRVMVQEIVADVRRFLAE